MPVFEVVWSGAIASEPILCLKLRESFFAKGAVDATDPFSCLLSTIRVVEHVGPNIGIRAVHGYSSLGIIWYSS